jgi:hypothetical protein
MEIGTVGKLVMEICFASAWNLIIDNMIAVSSYIDIIITVDLVMNLLLLRI